MLAVAALTAGCASIGAPARTGDVVRVAVGAAPSPSASTASAAGLARFDAAVHGVLAADPKAGGEALTTALIAAGFSRSVMQVTADRTSVGLPVPSVQFAVRWHGECLIGQTGPDAGAYTSQVAAPVDGSCLLGATRPITW